MLWCVRRAEFRVPSGIDRVFELRFFGPLSLFIRFVTLLSRPLRLVCIARLQAVPGGGHVPHLPTVTVVVLVLVVILILVHAHSELELGHAGKHRALASSLSPHSPPSPVIP